MSETIENIIDLTSSNLWNIFLPLLLIISIFIISKTIKNCNKISRPDHSAWKFSKIKSSFSISLSSKIGTGAIIGILAAMWKSSSNGVGGESIVIWVFIGVFIFVPITYSEVLFTQVTKKKPREFINYNFPVKLGGIYALCLVVLYSFGFVGFQFTGILSVSKLLVNKTLQSNLTGSISFLFIILPLLLFISIIVITKNHTLFINLLGSIISVVILSYLIFSIIFLFKTITYLPDYITAVINDFFRFQSASLGLPIGCIVGFQRIIQTGETGLGTSALASSAANNPPRREALIQTISTITTIFIAVFITTYVFSYGVNNISGISLTANGLDRISAYLHTVLAVTGYPGIIVISIFFLLSGMTTVLGSFHYLNNSMHISVNNRIVLYIFLISSAGILSVINFNIIFNATDLLMFIIVSINLSAMFIFVKTKIKKYHTN